MCVDRNLDDSLKKAVIFTEMSNIKMEEKITDNYGVKQDEYILCKFEDNMAKVERDLFKKWNLKDGIYMDDEDSELGTIILKELVYKYDEVSSMSEIKDTGMLDNCMDKIVQLYNEKLDNYAKEHKLDSELLKKIKNDVPELVSKHFNQTVNKLFNDKIKNKLEKLCDRMEEAYSKSDFDKMEEMRNEISTKYSKIESLYKDDGLYYRLSLNLTRSTYISNKIKAGREWRIRRNGKRFVMASFIFK